MSYRYKQSCIWKHILFVAFALAPLSISAAPAAPDTGSILQQMQPPQPSVQSPGETGLKIEPEGSGQLPSSAPFEVKIFQLTGNTLFDTATLHALLAGDEGNSLTLPQLGDLAARITDYYRTHGYPLARAFLPAQTIQNGIVHIEISEARYGKVELDNHSLVRDPLLKDTLDTLQSGQAIAQNALEHSLLLLSDIPGIVTSATLKPGATVGTSDLMVEATHGQAISGNGALDNYGSRYTGRARASVAANYNNPLRHGDVLGFNGLTSGNGLSYGHFTYEYLLNGRGTKAGGSYSALRYMLGDTLSSINAHGTATVSSLWVKHPFLRSQSVNLYGQIQYDKKKLRDEVPLQTNRRLRDWTISMSGDARDAFSAGAVNTWSLGGTLGRVKFDNASAQASDAQSTNTQGHFLKWNASLTHLQNLSPQNVLYLALSVQGAGGNLDPSEKMVVGGPYTVRAYEMGALSGDAGYLINAEFRRNLEQAWHGKWQAIAFVDSASVTVNKRIWIAGTNSATLNGAGVGVNWTGQDQWGAKAYIAARTGSTPVLVESGAPTRSWIEVDKGF